MQNIQASVKTRKKISLRMVCVLMIATAIISGLGSGLVCWQQATKITEERAAADMQAYIEEHSVSRSTTYQRLADSWTKTLVNTYADVVFFGDSITAGGLWEEYFPYLTPVNLGVVGDTIDGLIIRLPQIEMLMCEKCFVMIGVNDLVYQNTVEATLQKYEGLLKELAVMSNEWGTQVYLQSVLPVREEEIVYEITNEEIRQLNKGISSLADQYGMNYIDVHTMMADENGALKSEYSYDGLHLTENAYQIWQEILVPYLDE